MAVNLAVATANAMLNAITTAIGASGKVRIYSGSPPPAVATAPTGTLLAEIPLSATAFPAASSGSMSLNGVPLTTPSGAAAGGTAGYFRILTSGNVAVVQGLVGTSSAELILNTVNLVSSVNVSITSGTITLPGT